MAEQAVDIGPIKAQVWQKIEDVKAMMLKNDPQIAGHVKEIHKYLSQFDELVHLLTDEQIRDIVKVQKTLTGQMLISKTKTASNASIMKQARQITVDDL